MAKKPENEFKAMLAKQYPGMGGEMRRGIVGIAIRCFITPGEIAPKTAPPAEVAPSDTVGVPRALLDRLVNAADCYGVKHLDSDDMDEEAEVLQAATLAVRDALSAAPAGEEPLFTADELLWIANAAGVDTGTSNIRPEGAVNGQGLLVLRNKLAGMVACRKG